MLTSALILLTSPTSTLGNKYLNNWRNETSMVKRSYDYLPATWRNIFSLLRANRLLWDFLRYQTLEQMEIMAISSNRSPGRSHSKELLKINSLPKDSPYFRPFSPLIEVHYPDSTKDDGKSLWENPGVVDKTTECACFQEERGLHKTIANLRQCKRGIYSFRDVM